MSQVVVDDARIQAFLRRTHAHREDAASYLSRTNWNVEEATALYNRLHSDSSLTSHTIRSTSTMLGQQQPASMHIDQISHQLLPVTCVVGQPAASSFQNTPGSVSQLKSTSDTIGRKPQPIEATQKQSIFNSLPRLQLEKSGALVFVKSKTTGAPLINSQPTFSKNQPHSTGSLARVQPIEIYAPPPVYEDAVGDWTPMTSSKECGLQSEYQASTVKPVEDTAEQINPPRLVRGLSRAFVNVPLVALARDSILRDVQGDDDPSGDAQGRGAGDQEQGGGEGGADIATESTFVLPDITRHPEDLRAFLSKDLIDTCTLVSLEQGGHLNWWADIGACRRLVPMVTSGDGNCLLHAASLGMWGFHDRQLALRGALSDAMLTGRHRDSFRRRWRWAASLTHRLCGLELSEAEWDEEWEGVVRLASPQPRGAGQGGQRRDAAGAAGGERAGKQLAIQSATAGGRAPDCSTTYEFLEEIHVYVLAHILRRPIVVVAKTMLRGSEGEDLAPIPFGGIYLPLERRVEKCWRSPLLLTYDASHFCALVPVEAGEGEGDGEGMPFDAIPLVRPDLSLLPIHFLIDPACDSDTDRLLRLSSPFIEEQLSRLSPYMDIVGVRVPSSPLGAAPSSLFPDDFRPRTSSWGNREVPGVKSDLRRTDSDRVMRNTDGSVGTVGEGKEKNKGVSKQIVSMAKSIGNFGKAGKGGGGNGGGKDVKVQRKASIGTMTQSTRLTNQTLDTLSRPNTGASSHAVNQIICARLSLRRAPHSEALIRNYLSASIDRFHEEQYRRRAQHVEIRRLSASLRPVSFLPSGAPSRQQPGGIRKFPNDVGNFPMDRALFDQTNQMSSAPREGDAAVGEVYGAKGFPVSPVLHLARRQDTLVTAGKSKFYMTPAENHCLSPATEHRLFGTSSAEGTYRKINDDSTGHSFLSKAHQPLAKSKSDFGARPSEISAKSSPGNDVPVARSFSGSQSDAPHGISEAAASETSRLVTELWLKKNATGEAIGQGSDLVAREKGTCRTPGCEFHGTLAQGWLCSGCFQRLAAAGIGIGAPQTRL